MAEESVGTGAIAAIKQNSDEIVGHVSEYSYLIADTFYLIVIGLIVVFVLHKLAARFLFPFVENGRLLRVIFGTLYVLVLVLVVLMALKRMGFETSAIGSLVLLAVMVAAVVTYFLIPFLPRLPFLPGHTIETNGVMGTVDAVSTFHTTIRKFDGTMAFLPNALVVATRILNYSDTPNRRIEMSLVITPDSDLDSLGDSLVSLVSADERVLEDPAPSVFAMNADASGVQVTIFCWVKNDDFLGARSDLWLQLVKVCQEGSDMKLAPPKQEVLLKDRRS